MMTNMKIQTKKTKSVEELIQRGITSTEVYNILTAQEEQAEAAIKKLLDQHITEPELKRIMSQENNQQKIKHRMEHIITIYGYAGEVLAEIRHIGNRTIREIIIDIRNTLKPQEELKDWYLGFKDRLDAHSNVKYHYEHKKNGKVMIAKLTTILRKA